MEKHISKLMERKKRLGVILGIGERTTEFAAHLLSKQVDEMVYIQHVKPFAKALEEFYNIEYDGHVVLCAADCLILPDVVDKLEERMGGMRTSGTSDVKFRGTMPGGIMLYDPSYFPEALSYVSYNKLRPEMSVVTKFKSVVTDILTCIAEYELYYQDIYTRYRFLSRKAKSRMKRKREQYLEKSKYDKDYLAAYKGIMREPFDMEEKPPLVEIPKYIKEKCGML